MNEPTFWEKWLAFIIAALATAWAVSLAMLLLNALVTVCR